MCSCLLAVNSEVLPSTVVNAKIASETRQKLRCTMVKRTSPTSADFFARRTRGRSLKAKTRKDLTIQPGAIQMCLDHIDSLTRRYSQRP